MADVARRGHPVLPEDTGRLEGSETMSEPVELQVSIREELDREVHRLVARCGFFGVEALILFLPEQGPYSRDYLQSRLEFLKERMHHRGMAKGAEGKG